MPFTREQITDIKLIIKQTIEEFLSDDSFIKIFSEKIERKLEIKETQKKVQALEKRVDELQKENEKLQGDLDILQQHIKRKSFRVYGINESKDENITQKLLNDLNKKLKLDMTEVNIENCFRIGKRDVKNRPILFTVNSHNLKMKLLQKRKYLKDTGITIQEDMSHRKYLLLKKAIEHFGKGQAWYFAGDVIVKKEQKKYFIKNDEDLRKLI